MPAARAVLAPILPRNERRLAAGKFFLLQWASPQRRAAVFSEFCFASSIVLPLRFAFSVLFTPLATLNRPSCWNKESCPMEGSPAAGEADTEFLERRTARDRLGHLFC